MEVLELQDQDKKEWNEFVYGAAHATVFHLADWRDVFADTLGLQSRFLFAREGGQILGVLPLFHVKSLLSGHFLTSMPGGLCVEDEDAGQALIKRAEEFVKTDSCDYLVLRDSFRKWHVPNMVTNTNHCTFLVKLVDDPEQIWMSVNRRVRQSTKKAIRANVEVVNGPEYLDAYYPVYSRAMREKGTPTLGYAFFSRVLSQFPDHFSVMMVRQNGKVLGGGFAAFFKDTIYNIWGGMLPQYYHLRPNYLLYWETLKNGCLNGYKWVDLGRSARESGSVRFKQHWKGEPQQLYQHFYLNGRSQAPPVGARMVINGRYRLFTRAWRYVPLPLVEVLGPRLRQRMPFG
jgi:FemAB-related protein (PEP-CTERM system-associated)